MITHLKIKQLEEKCARILLKDTKSFIVRDVTEDGRLIGANDTLLTDQEIKRVEAENKEIHDRGGTVVYKRSYRTLH